MGRGSVGRPKKLPQKLVWIRRSLGKSQNQMIDELGFNGSLTQAEISAFELGKRLPPLAVLLKYARSSGLHVDDLIDDEIELRED